MKLGEALSDYIHVGHGRLRAFVEEAEDRGGECSAQCAGLDRRDVRTVKARENLGL